MWCLQLLCNTEYRVMVLMSKVSQVYSTLYTGPLTIPGGKAHCSHQSYGLSGSLVQEGSHILNFRDLSITMAITGKIHSQSQFLKLRGSQQPSNSYRSTKLHPPHPDQDCLPIYCTI